MTTPTTTAIATTTTTTIIIAIIPTTSYNYNYNLRLFRSFNLRFPFSVLDPLSCLFSILHLSSILCPFFSFSALRPLSSFNPPSVLCLSSFLLPFILSLVLPFLVHPLSSVFRPSSTCPPASVLHPRASSVARPLLSVLHPLTVLWHLSSAAVRRP